MKDINKFNQDDFLTVLSIGRIMFLHHLENIKPEHAKFFQYVGKTVLDSKIRLKFKSTVSPLNFSIEISTNLVHLPYDETYLFFNEARNEFLKISI